MKKMILPAALMMAASTMSAVSPMWVRDSRISPDGNTIAFVYKGDIYTVPFAGGSATRITSGEAFDNSPVWSPDGKTIAFSSDRNGGKDIYVVSAQGGTPKRLTFNSAAEIAEAFTPDGRNVLFSAQIQDPAQSVSMPARPLTELYSVPVEGGRISQILPTPAVGLSMRPDGSFLYENVKGMEDKWRKHHTSSVTRDIWLYNPADKSHTNLTAHAGEDRSPAASTVSDKVFFLSERDGGSLNVYEIDSARSGLAPRRLTEFSSHPVRFLSAGAGDRLAFTYNGELYTMIPGQPPRKLDLDVVDDHISDMVSIPFSSAEEALVSPDGKQVAFIVRGEVFVTSTEYPSTKQITHTPGMETGLAWGADGRTLYYGSLRNGRSNIWRARIARKDDPNFSNATLIEEECLFPEDGVERGYPNVSPDGKKLAFVSDRLGLKVMDLGSKTVTTLAEEGITNYRTGGFNVAWSPDSKWLTLETMNPLHEPYGDISIINVENGEMIPVTQSGYFDQQPRWSADGNSIIFASERYGMRNHASWGSEFDVMMAFLNKEAYDRFRLSEEDFELLKEVEEQQKKDAPADKDKKDKKGKKKDKKKDADEADDSKDVKIEREGLQDRIVRLTPNSSQIADFTLSQDGEELYYLSAFEGGYDLWKIALRDGDVSLVKKLDSNGVEIQTDKKGNIYLAGGSVKKFDPKSKELKNVSISGKVKIDPAKEREAMLDYVANESKERFYLPEMPVDWDAYVENYRRFLPHINNNYDFADLLGELLGELNVSHSGSRYFAPGANEPTASLGLLFDMNSDTEGVKVEEIVEGGPFDRATTKMKPGAVITAINGETVTTETDWTQLLNGTVGKKTLVSFRNPSESATVEEVILPVSASKMGNLLYKRWVKSREEAVDSLSNGRLGYVHIQSMDDESFRQVYSKLLGKFVGKEGIVIDTRWNGGGRLHEDIEVLFSGEKYLTQEIHGRKSSEMPSRRWNKPSVMIICEANYSNAHGTPWVYKHNNMGKLVGMPVPGTMSSVNWINLQDPSLLFGVPVVAFRTEDGTVLENTQLEPDVRVENLPGDVARGVDAQLEAAVRTLLEQLK